MLYEELDLSYDAGQLWSDEDVLGVHLDDGVHLHQQ
jgi:hypothetical protein